MKTTIYILLFLVLGCSKPKQDELSIKVYIPNAFLPNSTNGSSNSVSQCLDGTTNCNKIFRPIISNPNNIQLRYNMAIISIKKQTVFSTTDTTEGWDGSIQNKQQDYLPQGTYHYQIKITTSTTEEISHIWEGEIALLR